MDFEAKQKILIIDDDEDIRKLLNHKLAQQGYIICQASDGLAGFEKLKLELPDMVIVDVMMPGMDGFNFCEEVSKLEIEKHIPIIIMTVQDDQVSVNKAYEKGATDFITKPINQAKLNHRVRFSLRASETTEKLAKRERQLLSAQKIAKMGKWTYELVKNEFQFSEQVVTIFGLGEDLELSFDNFMEFVDSEDVARVREIIGSEATDNQCYNVEYTIKTEKEKSKRIRQIVDSNNNDPNIKFGIIQDITDLRDAEKKVRTLSFYDSVTGLPNRQFFKRLLDKTVASSKRHECRFALLDVNLDKFMRINTTFGHDVGDKLLIAASQRLNEIIRGADIFNKELDANQFDSGLLSHFGADNFIIMLNDINSADDAAKVARRINKAFEKSFEINGNEIHMTTSIGIGVYPDDAFDVESLLKIVSIALHNAKETGRNCYRFYTDAMNALSFQRLSLETGLRKALEREEFLLFYQPKISLIDGNITGAEALIRWNHPDMGLVSPADFIPLAEKVRI